MRHHAPPAGRSYHHQEPLYDPAVATPSHAERARTLLARAGTGVLSTAHAEREGHPYGSLVTYGITDDGAPVFLISRLAEHTRNLLRDGRCSLLASEASSGRDPLALGRVTIVGRAAEVEGDEVRRCFLERNPDASYYADYRDFHFWRMDVEAVRYIGGYGRMSWVDAEAWAGAEADPIADDARPILDHMNDDHADALVLYCRAFSKASDTSEATMVGVDRYGFEMSARTEAGPRPIRVAFDEPVSSAGEVRGAMVALVKRARAKLDS